MISIENSTIIELLGVTLFSIYAQICFATWMPIICHLPYWFHLITQFVFIGMPQAAIIILPNYMTRFYSSFGIYGLIGLTCSYLRFRYVQQKMTTNNKDCEIVSTGNNDSATRLKTYFKTKPECLGKRSNTISLYQTCIMMMTITAISAVDFKVFPSRFRKSKTFGISLMDIGVTLIISASGLVMTKYLHGSSKLSFTKLFKSSAPLLVLGLIKAILSEKYTVGPAEYGKHWNFFINLALIPFSLLFANTLPSIHFVPIICFLWMMGYQYMLTYRGYSQYILKPLNRSIWEQNKLGIFSFSGYCCLFLLSCYIGKIYHHLTPNNRNGTICKLLLLTVLLWSVFIAIVNVILPSRPLANFTYVLWGLSNGTLHALILASLDCIYLEDYRFIIFAEMISEYRLSTFLIANLASTAIRKVADIKSSSVIYELKVIFGYLSFTCLIVSIFFLKNQVKFYKKQQK